MNAVISGLTAGFLGVGVYAFAGYYAEKAKKAKRRKIVKGRHWRIAVVKSVQVLHDHNHRIEVTPHFPPKKNRTILFSI